MRICFSSGHRYPGKLHGVSSTSIHDNLVMGLAECGHEVFYHLPEPPEIPLPDGVIPTRVIRKDVDVLQLNAGSPDPFPPAIGRPWVRTIHCDIRSVGLGLHQALENWIYVSRTGATLHGSNRWVHNGIDPRDFTYSETKDNYLLFLCGGIQQAPSKGFDLAVRVARETGVELRAAVIPKTREESEAFDQQCRAAGVVFLGRVYGQRKADLLAGARALLFPSQLNEAFGLVIAEALISGTPVIGSRMGAIPEIIGPSTGFVCDAESDYLRAVSECPAIRAQDCRAYALERYHYLTMAKGYLREYEHEMRADEAAGRFTATCD